MHFFSLEFIKPVWLCVCMLNCFSRVQFFVTLWTIAYCPWDSPLSMGFSRHEYWSGFVISFSRDIPDPGVEPQSFIFPALAGGFFTTSTTWEAPLCIITYSLLVDMKLTQVHIFSWLLWGCQSWPEVSQYTSVNTVVNLSTQNLKKKQPYFSFYVWKTDGWSRQCLRSLPTWRFCFSIFGQTGKTWFKPI